MSAENQAQEIDANTLLRTFGPDDLDRVGDSVTESRKADFEIVLGPKQVAVALFLLLMQMGLVAGVAYIAGRSSAKAGEAAAAAVIRKAGLPAPPVIVTPSAPVSRPAEAPMPPVASPAGSTYSSNDILVNEPDPGLYLQIASVDQTAARELAKRLHRLGFLPKLAPGVTPAVVRVLVGPVDKEQVSDAADSLRASGFAPFPKRY